ncbi:MULTISPECIES: TetR/AcrR family transcriptional regulator [unclassified Rhodococcus (in: high G+C Gram-positive bacteria)]|uniref:TetR/AcrR family transcriptional regulator n=1 Tax=unclassified Rhodococcus (in: high G+C Gram-positive bacteria) TaxID=192944 RepID=UPI001639892E|nr:MULTISPECIES: TetR/AcrR family transcriptional regulator [unclassified Rhodococcus (in: high G+C Gram-positive bacteria)]MBC2640754.1 TetR/AcrR family transcriptional regulator [Rhodococcus sp. 3A]MBC2894501.1 TetR/AcrR family transcriptional regulator [Rhodococcus sp. 4CII]
MKASESGERAKARRPRDRRDQIAAQARELFTSSGYHAVRMDQIAEASGITARALYRHYANKQALLAHVILEDQQRWVDALNNLAASRETRLNARLSTLAEVGIASRRLSVLWQREARHLNDDDFGLVRDRTRWIERQVNDLLVRPARPELGAFATEVRSWAVVSILTSPAFYDSALSRSRLSCTLVDACARVIGAQPGDRTVEGDGMSKGVQHAPTSRREQLVSAATRAFRRNGYAGVSIDDIGSEVGMVGPAMYRYFDTKASILVTATTRFYEWQALETMRALARPGDDSDVLEALIEGYVRLSMQATDLLAVTLTEAHYLPQEARDRFDKIREENLYEWRRWLVSAGDDVSETLATTLTNIAKTVVNDLVRIPHLHDGPNFAAELITAVVAVTGV